MDFTAERSQMVRQQLQNRGIRDARVLKAMGQLPRELFVPEDARLNAYDDTPLFIGENQTISQPYIVALMTEALHLTGSETVLEVGTGSGYQTAILARLAKQVWSIEQYGWLASHARDALRLLELNNVELAVGDGSLGWPDHAPYDAILVAATAPAMPPPLLQQVTPGGRIVIPIGARDGSQALECWQEYNGSWQVKRLAPVRFVPLLGEWGH